MEQTLTPLNLNQLVALFLSEAIRSRRTSLSRAAEISSRVVSALPKIRTENQALGMLTEIEKDFEEVSSLKQALHFGYDANETKVFEPEIKEYAAKIFTDNIELSNIFLKDASSPAMTIQQLCVKYPDFCNYLIKNSDKTTIINNLKPGAKFYPQIPLKT